MPTPATPSELRIARSCYLSEPTDDLVQRCLSIVATCADDTAIPSVTAARLHGLWLPELPPEVHVATATPDRPGRAMTRTRRPEFVAHRFQLRPEDVVRMHGVPVTSLARTWLDLARVLGFADLVAAGDSALIAGVTTEELRAAIDFLPPVRRPRLAVAALPLLDERSRSRPESHLRVAATAPDLPRFDVNVAVHRDEGGWLAEPDLSLREAKLALEYLGADHAEVRSMRKDRTRTIDLRRAGWTVIEYGPAEVLGRPDEIEADVRAHLRDHHRHLLGRRRRTTPRPSLRLVVT